MKTYWASDDIDSIGSNIISKFEDYHQFIMEQGILSIWRKSYDSYHKPFFMIGSLNSSGPQGEYTTTCINEYKNLLDHILNMITQNRPALEPKANNTDLKSQIQTILSRGLLDYYLKEKDAEDHFVNAINFCLKYGEGFMIKEWDVKQGEVISEDPETGEVKNEGDLVFSSAMPIDVARDTSIRDFRKNVYHIVRRYENKFEMAARFPELSDKILGLSLDADKYALRNFINDNIDSDLIPVYRMYHDRTPILPQGRITECLREDIVTLDGPMPYKSYPVKHVMVQQIDRLNFGYTVAYDMLPIQEELDIIHSTITTNLNTFGVQNIMSPEGANLGVSELTNGLNHIQYDAKAGKPEALNLLALPPALFQYASDLSVKLETISGVNSVARGNPEAALKSASGSALALIQSMAIQFTNKLEQVSTKVLESVGMDIINDLRTFQDNERTAAIVGKFNQVYMKEYMAEDLSLINRVSVDRASALSKTVAGRLQIAQDLFEKQLIKTADEYYQVLVTGKLETVTEGVEAERLNIKAENERLSEGEQVPVIVTDKHIMHIQDHKTTLDNPEIRKDPAALQIVLEHIQDHINTLQDPANANILQLLGQQPLPPPQAPPNPQGAPDLSSPVLDPQNPVVGQAQDVNMPLAPQNPMTGERPELPEGSAGRNAVM